MNALKLRGRIGSLGRNLRHLILLLAPFTDFYFRGRMDGTGQRLVGYIAGSGFTGRSMTMVKQ